MVQNQELFDITIIGGGPTGLFTAFYAGMRQMKVKIIESLPQLGGQLSTLYPEKEIFDVAGFPKIKAKDLVANLITQANQFKPEIVLDEKIEALVPDENGVIELKAASGRTHRTKRSLLQQGSALLRQGRCRSIKRSHRIRTFTISFRTYLFLKTSVSSS
ncbi:thioredoxin reductase [Sporolactobacillus inulinus]|uniref:Thioredoxin reductase n=1 Tax=Sporolactobacillus inulinus TaxID=2078 RepID=A0A4Y1Z9T6_9BACL|nr:thioredoxin reductase [Sporolactobacillus inulinus]